MAEVEAEGLEEDWGRKKIWITEEMSGMMFIGGVTNQRSERGQKRRGHVYGKEWNMED